LLTVLFLFSYTLMSLLIIEQGNTINSQRLLIRQLFTDSAELSAMKGKAAQQQHALAANPKTTAPDKATVETQKKPALPRLGPKVNSQQVQTDIRRILITI
jgi:hypothetical protein